MWWDELERLTLKNNSLPPRLFFNNIIRGREECVLSGGDPDALFMDIHDELKYSTLAQRELILSSLRQQTISGPPGNEINRQMTFEEIRTLSRSPYATMGAHTINHISLGMQEEDVQQHELKESKHILEELTGKPVQYFAYPYGTTSDFSPLTASIASQTGFKLSFGNYYGFATKNTAQHKIPRILVRNWDTMELKEQINLHY